MKNNNKMRAVFAFAVVWAAASLFAEDVKLENAVSAAQLKELKSTGVVQVIHPKDDSKLSLLPECTYKSQAEKAVLAKSDKNVPFVAEFLYLVPKTELLKNSADKNKTIDTDALSVVFRSISKMQGMRYHVGEKGPKDIGELLYKKAYMIANPDSDEPIADKNTGNADGQISYCYQHDHTYGDTKYKLEYHQSGNVLYATFLNTLPLTSLGVKVIMPGNMRISIISIDAGDSVLLYLSTDCDAKKIGVLNVRKQIEESMTARIEAIYSWFMKQF
ncbi:MAG: DUF6675 family protein [Treponema sp.]